MTRFACDQILHVDDEGPHYCRHSAKFTMMFRGQPVERLCYQHLTKTCKLGPINNEYVIVDMDGRERQPEEFSR